MKTVRNINVKNKRVLVRCDFNVPLNSNGKIKNDFRIKQTIPTLKYLQKKGAKLILMSHRSDNKSLNSAWEKVKKEINPKEIIFLENLRLDKREESNNIVFAKELAQKGDVYVNDAFGVCHRNHTSITTITKLLPSVAGFLLEKEINILERVIKNPKRPLVAIIGGVKIKSKAGVIDNFTKIADYVLVGGKIASEVKTKSSKVILPEDNIKTFDIGPKTIKNFKNIIRKAKTILWAGPLGYFEKKPFNKGTEEIAKAIVQNKTALKVAGGGDTISAISKLGLEKKFDHLSTGGGAMLSFLAGEKLPGLEALEYYK